MEVVGGLNELNEKYKRNAKLSVQDSEAMIHGLFEILCNETSQADALELVLAYPPDMAMQSFLNCLGTLNNDEREKLFKNFKSNVDYKKNSGNKTVYRIATLVGKMLEQDYENMDDILFFIIQLSNLVFDNPKKSITTQSCMYIQKEILCKVNDKILNIKLSSTLVSELDFYYIAKAFLNSSFTSIEKVNITPKMQLTVLKWLYDAGRKLIIEEIERKLVIETCRNWPEYLIDLLKKEDFWDTYNRILTLDIVISEKIANQSQSKGDSAEYSPKSENNAANVSTEISSKAPKKVGNYPPKNEISGQEPEVEREKNFSPRKTLAKLASFIEGLEFKLQNSQVALENNGTSINQLKSQNDSLITSKRELEEKNTVLQAEIEKLANIITEKDTDIELLKKSLSSFKENIQTLHEAHNREDGNSLIEFKNKIASKLKYEYVDFKEVENSEINTDLGENFKIQLKNIFNELKRNGINLD